MGTEHKLSTLVGGYLIALEKADRCEIGGLTEEAQEQRNKAASLLSTIERDWSVEEIESAYRQNMELIYADLLSALDRCSSSSTGAAPYGVPDDRKLA